MLRHVEPEPHAREPIEDVLRGTDNERTGLPAMPLQVPTTN